MNSIILGFIVFIVTVKNARLNSILNQNSECLKIIPSHLLPPDNTETTILQYDIPIFLSQSCFPHFLYNNLSRATEVNRLTFQSYLSSSHTELIHTFNQAKHFPRNLTYSFYYHEWSNFWSKLWLKVMLRVFKTTTHFKYRLTFKYYDLLDHRYVETKVPKYNTRLKLKYGEFLLVK